MLTAHDFRIPLLPDIAALTIPERMLLVMRQRTQQGQPTTRDDFRQAEETCELSDAELDAHIGAAKRLASQEVVRQVSLHPDQSATRILTRMRREVASMLPTRQTIVSTLKAKGFSPREIDRFLDTALVGGLAGISRTDGQPAGTN